MTVNENNEAAQMTLVRGFRTGATSQTSSH